MGGASSIGVEDVRPSRDVQSLLIPQSHDFNYGSMSNTEMSKKSKGKDRCFYLENYDKRCFFD